MAPIRSRFAGRLQGRAAVFLALLVAGSLAACSGANNPTTQTGFVSAGSASTFLAPEDRKPAPDLAGELLGGGSYSLADDRGDDVMVINVWGSWCAPCRAEAPALEDVYEEVKDQGVQFLGINTRDQEAQALAFVARFGVTYPSLVDDGTLQAGFANSLPVAGIPTTFVIDRQGRVAARTLSTVTYSSLLALLEPVLAEDTGPAAGDADQ